MAVSFVGFSVLQAGTAAAVTVSAPSGTPAAGDYQIVFMASKLSGLIPPTPTGFNLLDTAVVGTGADGAGTGPIRLTAWGKELTGAAAGVSVSNPGGNVFNAGSCCFRKASTEFWNVTVGFGSDTSSGTSFSAVVPNMFAVTGDHFYYFDAVTLNTTRSADSMTATGCTLAAITGVQSGGTASGNQMFTNEARTNVTAGSQTGTATCTATHAAATTGGSLLIRASVAPKPRPTPRMVRQAVSRAAIW